MHRRLASLALLLVALLGTARGFAAAPRARLPRPVPVPAASGRRHPRPAAAARLPRRGRRPAAAPAVPALAAAASDAATPNWNRPAAGDPSERVARRIVLTGDVNGGYYRSCVKNEASRFRKLVGTMSPPEEGEQRAEVYVEGKRRQINSFVRWCETGDVGLSQTIRVESVVDETPIGLYDDFYVKTKE